MRCSTANRRAPSAVRFGEKGPLWLEITVNTAGAHGAYTHASKSASRKRRWQVAAELEKLGQHQATAFRQSCGRLIDAGRATMDRAMGTGAGAIVNKVTLNIGTIKGGVKVNMVAIERLLRSRRPAYRLGVTREQVLAEVDKIIKRVS